MNAYFNKETVISISKKVLTSPLFWIFIFSIFLLRTILFTLGTPHHGDLTYPTTIVQYQKGLFPLWNESTSDSNLESIDRGFSLLLVLFVRLTGGEVDLLSKLYFFIPLFVSGVTTAYLVKYILQKIYPNKSPNKLAIILASFMYMISPWVLEQVQAPFFWLAYAVTPGIILLSYRYFLEHRLSFGIGLATLWTIASTTPHYTLFSFLIIFFVWLVSYVQIDLEKITKIQSYLALSQFVSFASRIRGDSDKRQKFRKDLKLWGILAGFFAGLNAYWIVVTALMLLNGSVTPGYVFTPDMLKLFSQNADWHVLSGTDQWSTWWSSANSGFIISFVEITSIVLPLILILSLWIGRKSKGDLRLFSILIGIWIIGVFFALGGNNPVYTWLATSAPLSSSYGWLLRVPGKISYLLWPAYAVSTGLVVQSVYSYCSYRKNAVRKKALVLAAVVFLLIASTGYAVMKAQDYFNYYYAPVPVPPEYQQAFFYISNDLNDARIVDFARYETRVASGHPLNSLVYEASYTWNPGRIAGYFVSRSVSAPSIGYYHFTYSGTWRPAYENFQNSDLYGDGVMRLGNISSNAALWFPVYGVNYVLYHNDISGTESYAQHDLQVLNKTGCQLVKQWGDYIYLYRVPQSFGRIYALNSSWTNIEGLPPTAEDVNASGVSIYDIKQVDVTRWELRLNASKPFSLIFTEGFDPYWAATVNASGDSFLVNSQNVFGSINSFPINQTGELHITIQYKPQVWLYYGLTVSILFLITVSITLIYFLVLKRKSLVNKHPIK